MATLSSLSYARTRVRQAKTGQRVRLVATITAQQGGTFNLTSPVAYARVTERMAAPYFAYSNYGAPPYEHETMVAGSEGMTEPRFCWDSRRRILVVLNDSGTILERASDDDGYSFNAATEIFASGSHPDISQAPDGLILRAAYVGGALSIRRQYPGDSSPGSAFSAKDSAGVDLSLTDDVFRLVADPRGTWHLHCRLGAGAATSLLESDDDGATWAATSGAVTGITSGTRPGLAAGADGALYAFAHVAGEIQLTRRMPGDTAWSTPVIVDDAAGADLQIEEAAFSMAVAYEGPRRVIFAGLINGESIASDWGSGDDGASFERLEM